MIDLRSDTVTLPTPAMREAMAKAEVGDDVYGEDPTVNELERSSAELLGKEAALLAPSGTFANQCAILTHCPSGSEVLLAERGHILRYERAGAAVLSRVQTRPVGQDSPHLRPEDILLRIRDGQDDHCPPTGLVCVEQATSDGTVVPVATLAEVTRIARKHGVPVHMDGARLFNAAAALKVEPKEIARYADSLMFCLSKGLCAPVGSVLAGSKAFIDKARLSRKLMGGGMRQAGVLAAAGLVGLKEVRPLLAKDHEKARRMADRLKNMSGVRLVREPEVNMVFVRLTGLIRPVQELVDNLASKGFRIFPDEQGIFRFVTHQGVGEADVDAFVDALGKYLSGSGMGIAGYND